VSQDIAVSFDRIIKEAGVSRGAIRKSIDKALQSRFIACVQKPLANHRGRRGQVGEYSLRWHDQFTTEQAEFHGFYAGDGRRTPIPHEFFTQVLPHEPLGVIRVVAAVIRHTVGYSNQFGGRRLKAPLSYTMLQRYTHLSSSTLAESLRVATASGYITPVELGTFVSDRSIQKATSYSLHWLTTADNHTNGTKIEAGGSEPTIVQKSKQIAFRIRSSNGSEFAAETRFRNRSSIKETTKQTLKQQHKEVADGAVELNNSIEGSPTSENATKLVREYHRLRFGAGDCQPQPHELKHAAALLATDHIEMLTGLLPAVVRLVQESYKGDDMYFGAAAPYFAVAARNQTQNRKTHAVGQQSEEEHLAAVLAESKMRQSRQESRAALLLQWAKLPTSKRQQFRQLAIVNTSSNTVRRRLSGCHDLESPTTEMLDAMSAARPVNFEG